MPPMSMPQLRPSMMVTKRKPLAYARFFKKSPPTKSETLFKK